MMDPTHIKDAYLLAAKANHYLVTVATKAFTLEEMDAAEQLLITLENVAPSESVSLALDLCQHDTKRLGREG